VKRNSGPVQQGGIQTRLAEGRGYESVSSVSSKTRVYKESIKVEMAGKEVRFEAKWNSE